MHWLQKEFGNACRAGRWDRFPDPMIEFSHVLLAIDIVILLILLAGAAWNAALPDRRIWPPPHRRSWQHVSTDPTGHPFGRFERDRKLIAPLDRPYAHHPPVRYNSPERGTLVGRRVRAGVPPVPTRHSPIPVMLEDGVLMISGVRIRPFHRGPHEYDLVLVVGQSPGANRLVGVFTPSLSWTDSAGIIAATARWLCAR